MGELRGLFAAACFADVHVETVARTVRFAATADYVRAQVVATPLATVLAAREPSERELLVDALRADVDASLASYIGEDVLALPQEVHIAVATA